MTSGAWRSVFFSAGFPVVGIDPDFALGDDAVLVLVHVLDRVFDGDDVAVGVLVAVIDQRGQRGRLAGTGAADEDDQAALGHRQILEHRRQPSSSSVGMLMLMVRQTTPTRPCWTSALTRKRPMPAGEMAKLHSLVASNSAA
jgi:hypothetical protein